MENRSACLDGGGFASFPLLRVMFRTRVDEQLQIGIVKRKTLVYDTTTFLY
jgi:hypothetical protein